MSARVLGNAADFVHDVTVALPGLLGVQRPVYELEVVPMVVVVAVMEGRIP